MPGALPVESAPKEICRFVENQIEEPMILSKPKLEQRPAQYYAAIRTAVPIPFGKYLVPLWDEVFGWLKDRGVTPSGPSIIRYLTTDMSKKLDIDVGFTLDAAIPGDERVSVDFLPAGRYATLLYTGPYKGKGAFNATVALLEWAQANNIAWSVSQKDGVEWWNGRTEFYLTDPDLEHDTKKYQTELAFLTRS
ncbi:MAG: AraC family transcriptional regulator [Chloroflexi bacterium HGW-Chloroflexi-6]|nr:MAG: AraC family transcriptional regulator [Chloroflexi bacterium HGW-Chloroflexi-6]